MNEQPIVQKRQEKGGGLLGEEGEREEGNCEDVVNKQHRRVLSPDVQPQGSVKGVSVETDLEHIQPTVLPRHRIIKVTSY